MCGAVGGAVASGCKFVPIDADESNEMLQIRGYRHVADDMLEYTITHPHSITIESN